MSGLRLEFLVGWSKICFPELRIRALHYVKLTKVYDGWLYHRKHHSIFQYKLCASLSMEPRSAFGYLLSCLSSSSVISCICIANKGLKSEWMNEWANETMPSKLSGSKQRRCFCLHSARGWATEFIPRKSQVGDCSHLITIRGLDLSKWVSQNRKSPILPLANACLWVAPLNEPLPYTDKFQTFFAEPKHTCWSSVSFAWWPSFHEQPMSTRDILITRL